MFSSSGRVKETRNEQQDAKECGARMMVDWQKGRKGDLKKGVPDGDLP